MIYYNARYDLIGLLQESDLMRLLRFNDSGYFYVLTDEWVLVGNI